MSGLLWNIGDTGASRYERLVMGYWCGILVTLEPVVMKVDDFSHVKPLSKKYMLQLKYVNYKIFVGCPEFDFKQIKGFSLFQRVHTGSGIHTSSYSKGIGLPPLRVKCPGSEADYPPSSRIKVKNEWSYNPSPPICLHGTYTDYLAYFY